MFLHGFFYAWTEDKKQADLAYCGQWDMIG